MTEEQKPPEPGNPIPEHLIPDTLKPGHKNPFMNHKFELNNPDEAEAIYEKLAKGIAIARIADQHNISRITVARLKKDHLDIIQRKYLALKKQTLRSEKKIMKKLDKELDAVTKDGDYVRARDLSTIAKNVSQVHANAKDPTGAVAHSVGTSGGVVPADMVIKLMEALIKVGREAGMHEKKIVPITVEEIHDEPKPDDPA